LNAASSLRYPIYFPDGERRVELTGEAYFEIAKKYNENRKRVPFRVGTRNQIVEVLGTHFNISSYEGESLEKTTLLEGSVKVSNGKAGSADAQILRPGEQAQTKVGEDKGINVVEADAQQTVAWKDGYFMFRNTDLKDIVKELERWYDVKAEYESVSHEDKFTGYISRNVKISRVLKMLEEGGGIKFTVKGKKVKIKTS
jgi:ferric-dicitrate binding protein FerR (iron transport regulator)